MWTGSMEMPRGCGTPGACQAHFILSANQIALGELSGWVSPRSKERPWYRVLESSAKAGPSGPSFLTTVRASGQVTADRLQVQSLTAARVSAKVSLDGGKLQITGLNADFLGGKHRGQWLVDFSVKPAVCSGSGSLTGVPLERVADAMRDEWIEGAADSSYEVKGLCSTEFWQSAEGVLQVDMKDGILPHVALSEDSEPFKVTDFTGQARLHAGGIEIEDAKLDSPDGKFQMSGTASLKGELDLKLARVPGGTAPPGYTITGTLAEPRVIRSTNPETQARLKP